MQEQQYGGFWVRVLAALIDTILVMMIIAPILTALYGREYWVSTSFLYGFWDFIFSYALPAVAVIVFWVYKSATPGKMLTGLKIVDARTGEKPSTGQFIGRYLAYYVSTLPLLLGLIWVAFDKRKQGWHDKLAGTIVIKKD